MLLEYFRGQRFKNKATLRDMFAIFSPSTHRIFNEYQMWLMWKHANNIRCMVQPWTIQKKTQKVRKCQKSNKILLCLVWLVLQYRTSVGCIQGLAVIRWGYKRLNQPLLSADSGSTFITSLLNIVKSSQSKENDRPTLRSAKRSFTSVCLTLSWGSLSKSAVKGGGERVPKQNREGSHVHARQTKRSDTELWLSGQL